MNSPDSSSHKQFLFSGIDELVEENIKLKEKFENFKSRFNNIVKSRDFSPYSYPKKSSVLKEALITAFQKLEILKKERTSFLKSSKISAGTEEEKKRLEEKLKKLQSENEVLRSKKAKNAESAVIEKELLAEIGVYKKKVAELEEHHEKNVKILKDLKDQRELSEEPNKDLDRDLERLWKIEKNLVSSIKSNEVKNKQMLKDLETSADKLSSEKVCLQMKILKTDQQDRLLQMTIEKTLGDSQQNFTDANFLYKPSIKRLYN